ncbi:MAG: HD domain-containing protein [Chlorobiaceae bacterium]|nr:HD domain-containing protein [Chlorobiaceae bacterium]
MHLHNAFCPDGFILVSKHFLMNLNGEATFDLYVGPSSEQHANEPLLLMHRYFPISKLQDIVTSRGFEQFFIKKEDLFNFHLLVENNISMLIDNQEIPLVEKSKIIYNCASQVIEDIFHDPRSGKNLKRVDDISRNIIQFAFSNDDAIPSLLQLGSHDYYTFTHCLNVAVFSIGLWRHIHPMEKTGLQDFAFGCLLHDIGKTKIDEKILKKPGPLTSEEFSIIKKHPQYGYELMADLIPETSLNVILHHHEKHSGKGYPDGLKGNQVSDFVKIVAIADVYDALTTRRIYANARDPFEAMLTMKEEMVGHFEQEKFIAFVLMLSGGEKPRITNDITYH